MRALPACWPLSSPSHARAVNDVPIFIKGANLVPLHVLPTNVTTDMIADLLQYALDSNMNMIRIWGGGMYPVSWQCGSSAHSLLPPPALFLVLT